jgi:hypothetical protein
VLNGAAFGQCGNGTWRRINSGVAEAVAFTAVAATSLAPAVRRQENEFAGGGDCDRENLGGRSAFRTAIAEEPRRSRPLESSVTDCCAGLVRGAADTVTRPPAQVATKAVPADQPSGLVALPTPMRCCGSGIVSTATRSVVQGGGECRLERHGHHRGEASRVPAAWG